MSDSPPAAELRRSVALLATEWWLLVGVLAGYLVFGAWVVGTGLAVAAAAPSLTATVGTTTVTAATVFAALAWLLLPAAVVTWLFERRLSNSYGNLRSHYRFDHPGVLPAPSGVAVLVFVVAAAAVGPHPAVVALGALGSAHLLVRTVAFGRRVYSFSPRRLFPLLTGLSAIALAAGWLVHAPGLPGPVGATVRRAGVESVVDTGTAVVGTTPATALGALVAVPALLSGLYLVVQTVAARRVRARAPLAAPDKRAEQR